MHSTKVLLGLALLGVCALSGANASADPKRDGKLLNIFQVVRFPNEACNTTANDQGVCYTEAECKARDGTNAGSCASGFGVCCSFSVKCGATTNQNNTYFTSTDTDTSPCTVKICPCSDDICQIRLDFDRFDIAQPVTTGAFPAVNGVNAIQNTRTNCVDATFTATSDGTTPPIICGTNTGYHMILEADGSNCNTLSFGWQTATPRTWKIKTSQISCKDPNKPPEGCLQYYTGATGTVASYNFQGGTHLANQDYEACIRTEQGNCQINWSTAAANAYSLTSTTTMAQAIGDGCSVDYIVIPAGFKNGGTVTTNNDRYCGATLFNPEDAAGASVSSRRIPFSLRFITDAGESTQPAGVGASIAANDMDAQLGFSLDYTQTAC